MKYNILLICLFLMLSGLYGCYKRCTNPTEHLTISDEVLNYFGNYKEGNYWVYKNTKGDKIDSK